MRQRASTRILIFKVTMMAMHAEIWGTMQAMISVERPPTRPRTAQRREPTRQPSSARMAQTSTLRETATTATTEAQALRTSCEGRQKELSRKRIKCTYSQQGRQKCGNISSAKNSTNGAAQYFLQRDSFKGSDLADGNVEGGRDFGDDSSNNFHSDLVRGEAT